MAEKFKVTGMTCSACSAHVDKAVSAIDGVSNVNVNLLTNTMTAEMAKEKIPLVIEAVKKAGYEAQLFAETASQPSPQSPRPDSQAHTMKLRMIWSLVLLIPLMYVSMGHMAGLPLPMIFHENGVIFAFTQFLLCLPIILINYKYFVVGFKRLFTGAPNMDSLIAVGSGTSLLYGVFAIYVMALAMGRGDGETVSRYMMNLYFESAAMILALITLGKYLEARSKGKTSEAISRLLDLAPKTAVVLRDGEEVQTPVEQVVVGDEIVVRPGESIPVDGEVVWGTSAVDESAITGESIPVDKSPGDHVSAASINKFGTIHIKATRVGQDTTLSQIIRLVEEASSSKAPISRLADKVSGVFVPVVIGLALITFIVWMLLGNGFEFALNMAISVLVISCPCALGLATPVAIMAGTGKGAENGILIRSAEALELMHKIDTIVLDKTGTVTKGQPVVTDIVTSMDEQEFLKIAAAIEKPSEHPLAQAIVTHASHFETPSVDSFQAISGKGVEAKISGSVYLGGNMRLMEEMGVSVPDDGGALARQGKTPMFFAKDGAYIGTVAVADIEKPTAAAAVAKMKAMGIKVMMLTGDNKQTAEAIGGKIGIDETIAQVLPGDKEQVVARLKEEGRMVAMVGDGINDAPALARADVGIAIGAGTDVAIEAADMVLMKSDPMDIVTAIELSRRTLRNIKQNLFWAFFYNVIGIPLAAGVFYGLLGWALNPMFAAAAMSLSSVTVVSNALRLRGFKRELREEELPPPEKQEQLQAKIENKGAKIMTKTIFIEGMSCGHCSARVEKALNDLQGVSAKVDLEGKKATVEVSGDISDDQLKAAVTDAGYEVTGIE